MKRYLHPGINIQFPISQEVVNGKKTVETRTYPLPNKYIGIRMCLIETPGDSKSFKARIVAIVEFKDSFEYSSKADFAKDYNRHCVSPNSKWSWNEKKKWGWSVNVIKKFDKPVPLPCRTGIRFTKEIPIQY